MLSGTGLFYPLTRQVPWAMRGYILSCVWRGRECVSEDCSGVYWCMIFEYLNITLNYSVFCSFEVSVS